MVEKIPKENGKEETKSRISRREFLKDAGLIVGGATVGSMALINACSGTETVTQAGSTITATKTTTVTQPGGTGVVTTTVTQPGGTGVVTVTGPSITKVVETASTSPTINLTVNQSPYQIQVKPNWTLQEVLREHLGFMSPKDMCFGYGACGSCSVIVEGRPILSCLALAIDCNNKTIETAEGIADSKHPLVDSYVVNHCMQCGYCTPGFIVTAKALLDHKPNATEDDIRDALGGNICRCGTYPAHIRAVLEVAK